MPTRNRRLAPMTGHEFAARLTAEFAGRRQRVGAARTNSSRQQMGAASERRDGIGRLQRAAPTAGVGR